MGADDPTVTQIRTELQARDVPCGPLRQLPLVCLNTILTDDADVLVKVSAPGDDNGATSEVANATWAAAHGLPTPVPLCPEPFTVSTPAGARTVTVWRREQLTGTHADARTAHQAAIATAVRAFQSLHALPAPPHAGAAALPALLARVHRRMNTWDATFTWPTGTGPDLITTAADDAYRHVIDLWDTVPHVWTHGDLHPDNVLITSRGALLGDWGSASVAPREWDYAPLLTPLIAAGAFAAPTDDEPASAHLAHLHDQVVADLTQTHQPHWDLLNAIVRLRTASWASMLWERGSHPERLANFAAFLLRHP